jgi:hypothetical protein
MGGPAWLAKTLAAVMIATAAYCFTRLVVARRDNRPTDYDVDGVHILMGVAMAGMLVPHLNPFWDSGWEVIFGGALGWFGWQTIRGYRSQPAVGQRWAVHHLQHVLACGAMLYMFLAVVPARAGHSGSGIAMGEPAGSAATFPTLALLLTLALVGYVIWTADRLTSLPAVAALSAMAARATAAVAPLGPGAALSLGAPIGPGAPALAASSASASGAEPSADGTAARVTRPDHQPGAARPAQAGPPMSPRLAACCEIAMGLTMGYMLITML